MPIPCRGAPGAPHGVLGQRCRAARLPVCRPRGVWAPQSRAVLRALAAVAQGLHEVDHMERLLAFCQERDTLAGPLCAAPTWRHAGKGKPVFFGTCDAADCTKV